MAYDMLHNDLPAQPNLDDSYSIITAVPRTSIALLNNNITSMSSHQTPAKSITVTPNVQSPNNSMSDVPSCTGALAFEIASDISKHDVKQKNLNIPNPT